MLKKLFFIFAAFSLGFLFIQSHTVHAQQEIIPTEMKKCLKANQAGGQTRIPPSPVTLNLTGQGLPSDQAVKIEFCQPSQKKTQCSVVATVNTTSPFIKTSVTMRDLNGHIPYAFYGAWVEHPNIVGAGGQQQGTFTFEDTKCVSIEWDPYGRVFDSQSLEPIPGVQVGLFDNLNPSHLTQTTNNPQTVQQDGMFNFLSKPGTYYLNVSQMPSGYSFTANPRLNGNYYKAYSLRNGSPSIYKPGQPIVETAGNPQHRDIPLDSGDNPPSHFQITNMPGLYDQMVFGSVTKYGGKISHPLSIVSLVGENSGKEYGRTAADKFGYWTIVLSNNDIPAEPLLIKLIKVDLTTGNADESHARVTHDIIFNPIFRTIKGYVYDTDGQPLKNSEVTIVLDGNGSTYYSTMTDNNGYISITSDNLPVLTYHIAYPQKGTGITTGFFAAENKTYFKNNNINPMLDSLPPSDNTQSTQAQNYDQYNQQNAVPTPPQNPTTNKTLPVILTLIIASLIIAYLIIKSNTPTKKRPRTSRKR